MRISFITRKGTHAGVALGGLRPRFKKLRHFPMPLPAPDEGPQLRHVASHHYLGDMEAGVEELARSYRKAVGEQGAKWLPDPLSEDRKWRLGQVVAVLMDAGGVNLDAFVTFVCERYHKLTGYWPKPEKVLMKGAFKKWLPIYRSHARETLAVTTYRQSPARKREYEERFHRGRPERPSQAAQKLFLAKGEHPR